MHRWILWRGSLFAFRGFWGSERTRSQKKPPAASRWAEALHLKFWTANRTTSIFQFEFVICFTTGGRHVLESEEHCQGIESCSRSRGFLLTMFSLLHWLHTEMKRRSMDKAEQHSVLLKCCMPCTLKFIFADTCPHFPSDGDSWPQGNAAALLLV